MLWPEDKKQCNRPMANFATGRKMFMSTRLVPITNIQTCHFGTMQERQHDYLHLLIASILIVMCERLVHPLSLDNLCSSVGLLSSTVGSQQLCVALLAIELLTLTCSVLLCTSAMRTGGICFECKCLPMADL